MRLLNILAPRMLSSTAGAWHDLRLPVNNCRLGGVCLWPRNPGSCCAQRLTNGRQTEAREGRALPTTGCPCARSVHEREEGHAPGISMASDRAAMGPRQGRAMDANAQLLKGNCVSERTMSHRECCTADSNRAICYQSVNATIFLDEDSHRDADEAQCEVPRPTRPNKDNATLVVGAGRAGGREAVRLFTTTPLAPRLANRKSWWPIHTSCKSR